MTLKSINEEVSVIKAHLDQDSPDEEFILRHAETLLVMVHQMVTDKHRSGPCAERHSRDR